MQERIDFADFHTERSAAFSPLSYLTPAVTVPHVSMENTLFPSPAERRRQKQKYSRKLTHKQGRKY